MAVIIRGLSAELRWGYAQAAVLGPWTLSASDAGGTVTATVVSANTFRVSQPSLTFHVPRQHAAPWVWPIATLCIADGTLTATLGPQE